MQTNRRKDPQARIFGHGRFRQVKATSAILGRIAQNWLGFDIMGGKCRHYRFILVLRHNLPVSRGEIPNL